MLFTPAETKVVIVGGGTMGADVAAVCARGGCAVQVVEPTTERRALLPDYFANTLSDLGYEHRIHLLSVAGSLEEVDWSDIDLVIECVPERVDIKQALFAKLEKLAKPETVLASNSSSFPISEIARGLKTAARMIGLHFFMPAHLVPCVEVVYGEKTSPMVGESLSRLMTACGMVPVTVKKDLPGFLANRLQHALSREAFSMVDAGIATLEDIDKAVRFGFGFRYLAAGPVMQRDHAGLEIHGAAGASIYPSLNNSPNIAKCLSERVASGKLGMKTSEGFFPWTSESIKVERKRYDDILRAGLQIIQKELPEIK
ncbi:3-hydroxyacyl-CoA dehydrogenase family protein [Polynucleobacter brandtiae]|uniref:3-hydroxybutyryl-CoA dehydrogenase n=1 Tax=Polynucleobacter brandtiae TaxID=1938816 RepID=A0A2M8VZK4_9BURK|nr:3-hydroxyacyl-CoA dehydrogenase NAD-binding domain-containing protein [Polynucleobacter brandtiae]PJI83285.1 3-hydroxybutyryl-CoA dehydrogenase [Polynucleobacter brandtiae]